MSKRAIWLGALSRKTTGTYYNDDPPPTVPPPPAPVPPTVPPPPAPPGGRVFTQADVDKLMAEHRKGLQQQNAELLSQLEELRKNVNLTQQEKDALDARIQTISQQHLTDSQKSAAEFEAFKKKTSSQIEELTGSTSAWKNQFERLLVTNEILRAAATHGAASEEQLLMMLTPQAKVVEATDADGKPIKDKFVAKLPVTIVDPKTKLPTVVDMLVGEAVETMRKDPKHANLFLVNGKPGLGGVGNTGGSSGGGTTEFRPDMSPEEYRKTRSALGLAPK